MVGELVASDLNRDPLTFSIIENIDPNQNGVNALRVEGNRLLLNDSADILTTVEVSPVAAGFLASLALREDGTVAAWGLNENGQGDVPEDLTEVAAGGGVG